MFQLKYIDWGKHRVCQIRHHADDTELLLAPGRGASLLRLRVAGWDFLQGYTDEAALDSLKWARSGWLYPFPNRLRDGQYLWQGKHYQFPLNDEATGNAIHGMLLGASMQLQSVHLGVDAVSVSCAYTDQGTNSSYPFPFHIEITYSLTRKGVFSARVDLENRGPVPAPFGLGWHPYFRVGEEPVDTWKLQVPQGEVALVDERMLPTGAYRQLLIGPELQAIEKRTFDSCLRLKTEPATLELRGSRGVIHWKQTNFPFLQLFTPEVRNSIAIEPMTCGVDALNTGEGLLVLAPGARRTFSVDLQLNVF